MTPTILGKLSKRTWKSVALRLGEELASVGPNGYYEMTPEQWLKWALEHVRYGSK